MVTESHQKIFFLLFKPCYSSYNITSKKFLSSFLSQLQQLQDDMKLKNSLSSSQKPVTVVTGSHLKNILSSSQIQLQQLQDEIRNSLSSSQGKLQQLQNHTKKFSFIFSNPVTAVTGSHQKNFLCVLLKQLQQLQDDNKNFLSSFQSQLQQLQDHMKLKSRGHLLKSLFQWLQDHISKIFYHLLKCSYSRYRMTRKFSKSKVGVTKVPLFLS